MIKNPGAGVLLALAAKWRSEGEYWTGSRGDAARQQCADDLLRVLGEDPHSFAMSSEDQERLLKDFGLPRHPSDADLEFLELQKNLQIEGDAMLERMNTPEARAAAERLMTATPEELGRAAVLGAAKEKLRDLMSDISEDHYCAGWLIGLEFVLWRMVQGGSRHFGFGEVDPARVEKLRVLSRSVGGWWMWVDGETPLSSGEKFVEIAEWEKIYAEHEKEHPEETAPPSDD